MIYDPASLRVLGALMEKEMTTPDLYPLSINALVAAANQRSSRDPVMNLSADEVRQALHGLEHAGLVTPAREGGRVARYEHRIRTVLNLRRDETAVLCLLLLRGPQTPGELRSRADRGLGQLVAGLLLLQMVLGVADVLLLAPTWLQVTHLLGADVLWIALIVLAARLTIVPVGCPGEACSLKRRQAQSEDRLAGSATGAAV